MTIRVRVAQTRGSVPREAGAEMRVTAEGFTGTIGGGALEHRALAIAREMLTDGTTARQETLPLGARLGQCCGGSVTLEFVATEQTDAPLKAPVVLWGAGHVGRAIAEVLAPHPRFDVTLADTMDARLPGPLPPTSHLLVASDLVRAAEAMEITAHHLVLTYSHDLDLALCDALLRKDVRSLGLIGSETKWARFRKRLTGFGHAPAALERIACPIGDKRLGKAPHDIAFGVAAALLRHERDAGAF